MRILYLSANILGFKVLEELISIPDVEVIGLVTLSPSSSTIMYDGIKIHKWKKFKIPIYQVMKVGDEIELIANLSPDLIFMCGWRQIIPSSLISLPPKGMIGIHPTLLPRGRGPAPIINSILQGFTESGVTMFYINEELDQGDIIGQEKFDIDYNDYAWDVYQKVIISTKKLVDNYIPLIESGTAPRYSQNDNDATFFPKRSLTDNEINLNEDVNLSMRKIKAFSYPYRGAFIKINNTKLIIWKASLET